MDGDGFIPCFVYRKSIRTPRSAQNPTSIDSCRLRKVIRLSRCKNVISMKLQRFDGGMRSVSNINSSKEKTVCFIAGADEA